MGTSSHPAQLPTRERLLALLRFGPGTVEELARELGLTPNGVRAQLTALERDGLVERQGVRHGVAPGKPPTLYRVTSRAETEFSRAYVPALRGLVSVLNRRFPRNELRAVFTEAGKELATRTGMPIETDPGASARELLASLGAAVTLERQAGSAVVAGAACPLADTVRECAESCELVRSLLAASTGAAVATECEHGASPRCRFRIS